jgi:hypothetical protein
LSSAPLAVCLTTACGLVNAPLESVNVALEFLPGQRLPIFSMSSDICHKTQTPPVPLPSPRTGLTSAYPWHYPGPLLLEPSFPPAVCGWLPAQDTFD